MVAKMKGEERSGRSAWLLVFLILNALGLGLIVWGVAFRQVRVEDMRIVSCTPQGEVSREGTREIMLTFDRELDPLTLTEDTIVLSPRVQGKLEPVGMKQLRFVLSDPLERATRYNVEVSRSLRGSHGESLGEFHFEFNTAPLMIEKIVQGNVDIEGGINLEIRFNARVDPRDLQQALTLKYKNNHSPAFSISGNSPAEHLLVHIPDFSNDTVLLTVRHGLAGITGPLALQQDYKAIIKLEAGLTEVAPRLQPKETAQVSFLPFSEDTAAAENIVYVSRKVCFTGMYADNYGGNSNITIEANTPFDASEAENYVTIEPAVIHSFEPRYSGLVIKGDFEAGKRYRVTLKKGLPAGIAGTLEETVTRSVWIPDRGEDIEFTYGGGYLSSRGMLLVPLRATNVREAELTVFRLYPENIVEYVLTGEDTLSNRRATEICRETLDFSAAPNRYEEKMLDLRRLAGKNPAGVYSLSVRGAERRWESTTAVVAVSDLGITSRVAEDSVLCWVTSLSSAEPVAGAEVTLYSDRRQRLGNGRSDENGLCRIVCPSLPEGEAAAVLVVQKDDDMSYLGLKRNQRRRSEEAAEGLPYLSHGYEAFVTAERGVYRLGDTVHVSAFVRAKGVKTAADIPLDLLVRRPDGKEFLRRRVTCDSQGRISEDIVTPDSSVTGYYGIAVTIPGEDRKIGSGGFRVEDYIPQTLTMKLVPADNEDFPGVEQQLKFSAQVKHLSGQPAEGLELDGKIECTAEMFSPDGWEGYFFTPAVLEEQTRKSELSKKVLDKDGAAEYAVECLLLDNAPVIRERVEITVHEKGGRSLAESMNRKFYPWKFYLGIKPPEGTVTPQQAAEFRLAVVGREGRMYDREIGWEAELYTVNWSNVLRKQKNGQLVFDWSRKERLVKNFSGHAAGEQRLQFVPENSGYYVLKIKAEGSYTVSCDFYVAGKDSDTLVRQDPDELKLISDSKIYQPGETAKISLQAPFAGTALVCVEGDTILSSRVVTMQEGMNSLEFAVDASWRPNVYVSVTLVRAVQAAEKWLPHRASGVARLAVDCAEKKLQVEIAAAESVLPAQRSEFRIHVVKSDGTAAKSSAVVFAAVDMGVLMLDDFQPENPWDFFYALRRLDVLESDMYSRLAPELAAWKAVAEAVPGGGQFSDAEAGRRLNPVKARRVRTAVLYAGTLMTDDNGDAVVAFDMPEYTGELKLMVSAADGDSFGMAQKLLPVRAPLMYQASWPRFLAPGDEFTVTLTLFNNTGNDGAVALSLIELQNLELSEQALREVYVKSGEQKTVELPFRAGSTGVAKARLKVSLDENEFAQSMELSVRPAAMLARRSMLSVVEPAGKTEIELEGDFMPGSYQGKLVVTGNPVADVSGQINYLLRYPYGCLEQTVSRMLPLLYMPDLARIVSPGAVGNQEISALIDVGLQRLLTMQTLSGGLAMWPGNSVPDAWATVYAADFMTEAKNAGYAVPAGLLGDVLEYLADNIGRWAGSSDSAGLSDRLDVAAYAAYVLCRSGRPPHSWLASLEERVQQNSSKGCIGLETARCYLSAAYLFCGEIEAAREFMSSLGSFVPERSLGGTFNSPRREKAIFISILLDVNPESAQIPALVAELRADVADPWQSSTQENAFVLQALGKYARRTAIDQEAEAVVYIDGHEDVFRSAQGKSFTLTNYKETVRVRNNGKTPLYVYAFSEGVPADGKVKEEDCGFSVRRSITDIADNIVTGELKQGGLYRIHLDFKAPRYLSDLVIVDMLAAGLEIENQDLKGAAVLDAEQKQKGMTLANVEKRDDRIIIFADIPDGESSYSYVVRAVTPGEFAWPACDAGAMYDPTLFSINGGGKLKVSK